MTYIAWPFDDLVPSAEGFSLGLGGGRLVTPMEYGPPKSGRKSSAVGKPIRMIFPEFPVEDLLKFIKFYEEDTLQGSQPWWMRDPIFHGERMTDESGLGIYDETDDYLIIGSWWLILFGEMGEDGPQITNPDTDFFRVEFPALILP